MTHYEMLDTMYRASMRPRHKAAENLLVHRTAGPGVDPASMRPRHKAAENAPHFIPPFTTYARFNEAAA